MGLDDLLPGNSKRARATAVNAFMRFLLSEGIDLAYLKLCITKEPTGQSFVSAVDKFGMYLAFNESMSGKKLSRHSCMQYYRQAKHWLLDQFPQQRVLIEPRLLKMGRTLENFCVKRDGGGIVKKAIACKKGHLNQMMAHMYKTARTGSDYQDAALRNLLSFLFGRASDLSAVRKQNITIDADGVFFLRLIRMKTSEEQGLSLFPDNNWITCPLLAIALALMAHVVPSCDLIGNLPAQAKTTPVTLGPEVSLLDLLDNPGSLFDSDPTVNKAAPTSTIHCHVNRILDRVLKLAGIDEQLTSQTVLKQLGTQAVMIPLQSCRSSHGCQVYTDTPPADTYR